MRKVWGFGEQVADDEVPAAEGEVPAGAFLGALLAVTVLLGHHHCYHGADEGQWEQGHGGQGCV